jgi:serine protease Do
MNNNKMPFINNCADIIVQIATPYSTGTGFYLKSFDLIVTNEHIVRGNKQVVISGATFEKQMVAVLHLDTINDIAFISPPSAQEMPSMELSTLDVIKKGDEVMLIEVQNKNVTKGKIFDIQYLNDDIHYILHDINMNPVNNGGPVFGPDGMIIGINTFNIHKEKNVGHALPSFFLSSYIKEYKEGKGLKGVRCTSCKKISFEVDDDPKSNCSLCGVEIRKISDIKAYEPNGICITVESLIGRLGYDVSLTRKGPNNWCIKKGSIDVCISYYEKTGLLVGDVYMCELPENNVSVIYEFLLKQNYILDGLTFSIRNNDIILSLLIYDQFINVETVFTLFTHLLHTSDKYDNILIDKYGGKSKQVSI